jgi:hypothetical protein
MLPIAMLKAGETYATVEQIRDVTDRATMPVEVPQWRHPDGTPFKVLIQAPSFRDATEIDRASKTADGEDDDAAFVLETCLRVLVEPKLTRAQLDILRDKNPEALDAICDTAWRLSRLSARAVAEEVRRLAGLEPSTPTQRRRARRAKPAAAAS